MLLMIGLLKPGELIRSNTGSWIKEMFAKLISMDRQFILKIHLVFNLWYSIRMTALRTFKSFCPVS